MILTKLIFRIVRPIINCYYEICNRQNNIGIIIFFISFNNYFMRHSFRHCTNRDSTIKNKKNVPLFYDGRGEISVIASATSIKMSFSFL